MRFQTLFVLFLALIGAAYTFSFTLQRAQQQTKSQSGRVYMAGGRSPAEQGMTSRQMFKELRSKFNTAAKEPSFFDKGDAAEVELYCKSNKDGSQIGDCPFAQFIQVYSQE